MFLPLDYNSSTCGDITRDYTLPELWEAATDNDLVTATKGEVLFCYPDAALTGFCVIEGATTNLNYWRLITTAIGEEQVLFSYNNVVDYPWQVSEDYSGFQNVGFRLEATHVYFMWFNNTGNHLVDCIVYDNGTATQVLLVTDMDASSGGKCFIINSLMYDAPAEAVHIYGSSTAADNNNFFYNTTIVNSGTVAFAGTKGNRYAKNCIAANNGTGFSSGWVKTTCKEYADLLTFNNPGAGDYSLAEDSTAVDFATNLSADGDFPFNTDILGVSRPQGAAWDGGAYEREYINTPPTVSDITPTDGASFDYATSQALTGVYNDVDDETGSLLFKDSEGATIGTATGLDDGDTGQVTWTGLSAGDYTFTVTPNDGTESGAESPQVTFTIEPEPATGRGMSPIYKPVSGPFDKIY